MEPNAEPTPETPLDSKAILAALRQVLDGGGAAPTPPKEEAAPPPQEGPQDIRAWLASLETRVNAREREEKAAAEAKQKDGLQKQVTKLIEGGDITQLKEALGHYETFFTSKLTEKETKLGETEKRLNDTIRRVQLSEATSGIKWASPAAGKQAMGFLEDMLEVVSGHDNSPTVRSKKDGRSVADVVNESLATDDFAHFLDPGQRRSGSIAGGKSASPTNRASGAEPDSLDDAIIRHWQSERAAGVRQNVGLNVRGKTVK